MQYRAKSFMARKGQTYDFIVYKFGDKNADVDTTLMTYMKEGRATLRYEPSRSRMNNGW